MATYSLLSNITLNQIRYRYFKLHQSFLIGKLVKIFLIVNKTCSNQQGGLVGLGINNVQT